MRRFQPIAAALFLLGAPLAAQVSTTIPAPATNAPRVTDPSLTQRWTGTFGESFSFPAEVKYNALGSEVKQAEQTERVNFIIPGGNGSIKVQYFTEKRMVPKGFGMLDSMRFADVDSAGRNGMIHRRTYILRDFAVQIDILLTDKGEQAYGGRVHAIFDSFDPKAGSPTDLEAWRYGRDPRQFEHGKTPNEIREGK